MFEQRACDCARNSRTDDEQDHTLVLLPAAFPDHGKRGADQCEPFHAEINQESYQCAEVKRNIKGESRIGPANRPWEKDQMRSAGYRQKFGQALKGAEYDRLKDSHL